MPDDISRNIIRSKRRTLALQVAKDATLIIRAPERMALLFIEKFVERCKPWIEKKQEAARALMTAAPQFTEGEEFLYLGQKYKLAVTPEAVSALSFDGARFNLHPVAQPNASGHFTDWYKRHAKEVLKQRIAYYSGVSGLKHAGFKINGAATRWGSCSPGGSLNFCWRLVMAPLSVIDYVVVHELAHTVHLNHSARFWAKVEKIMPDYRHAKAWLRKNEHLLGI